MVIVPDEIIGNIKKFLGLISDSGFRVERAIVFGSYAKGNAEKWSDIDVALVSKDFTGVRFYDRKRVNRSLIRVDSRIEPHPFKPNDFTKDDPFVEQILRDGIEITIESS